MAQVPAHSRSRATHRRVVRRTHNHDGFEPPLEGGQSGVDQTVLDGVYGDQNLLPGSVHSGTIRDDALVISKFTSDLRPVGIVAALPTLPDPEYPIGSAVVVSSTGTLYRNKADVWTSAVASFSGGVEVVAALPTLPDANYPSGALVVLTADWKLYRNQAGTWTRATDGADILADTITAGAIAAGAIGVSELAADSVTAGAIAAGAVSASEIAAGAVHIGHMMGSPVNLTPNPSLEFLGGVTVDTPGAEVPGWQTIPTDAQITDNVAGHSGNHSIRIRQPGTPATISCVTDFVPVIAGRRYIASQWTRGGASNTGTGRGNLNIRFQDGDGVQISTTTVATHDNGSSTTWVKSSGSIVAPATAVSASIVPNHSSAGAVAGDDVYFDDMEFYPGDHDLNHAGGNVQIDSSGVLIQNGALTIQDEFAETVMVASGFSGTWADFFGTGLYNGNFASGSTGGLTAGRTAALPYWTVTMTNSSGTATFTRTADTNYPGGHSIRFTPGSTSDKLKLVSDKVGVNGYQSYKVKYTLGTVVGGSGDFKSTITIDWIEADGSTVARSDTIGPLGFLAGHTYPGGLAFPGAYNYIQSLDTPVEARYAKVTIEVQEQTAHNAADKLYIGGLSFLPDDLAEVDILNRRDLSGADLPVPFTAIEMRGNITAGGPGFVVSGMEIDANDYRYLGRLDWIPARIEGFLYDNLAASLTDAQTGRFVATQTNTFQRSPIFGRNGRIVAVAWRKSAAITAGTCDIRLSVGGGASTLAVQLDSGSGNSGVEVLSSPISFSPTSSVTVQLTTNGAYLPTTLDYAVDVLVEYRVEPGP